MVALLVVGAILFWQSSLLDIDKFEAEGNPNTPLEHIVSISGLGRGDQLYALDLGAASKSVRRLPWVKDVSIKRDWGGTLTFQITERQPAAVAFSNRGYVLLDEEGRILELLGTELDCLGYAAGIPTAHCVANMNVPSAAGATVSEQDAAVVAVSGVINRFALGESVHQVARHTDIYAVSIRLAAGGWIYLGNPMERLEDKLVEAIRILNSEQLPNRFCGNAVLDMSVEGRAALTPDSRC